MPAQAEAPHRIIDAIRRFPHYRELRSQEFPSFVDMHLGKNFIPANRELETSEPRDYGKLLEARRLSNETILCVGLDPNWDLIPAQFKEKLEIYKKIAGKRMRDPEEADGFAKAAVVVDFLKDRVDQTLDLANAVKPQIAYFEGFGHWGLAALRYINKYVHAKDATVPIIIDAKRGDIGSTNEPYASSIFDYYGADAMTVNPYLGIKGKKVGGALDPILNYGEGRRGTIIICRTSNDEGEQLQNLITNHPKYGELPLWQVVAHLAEEARQTNPNVGIVVGATNRKELEEVRKIFKGFILVPGYGAQGGMAEDAVLALDENGGGAVINSARAVLYPKEGKTPRGVASASKDELNAAAAARRAA
jgi:orotidine-5'-phosphate decarboxylase